VQGIVLPPACTGVYPFASDVGIMSAAVTLWLTAVLIYMFASHADPRSLCSWTRLAGRVLMTAALIIYPAASTATFSLLYCVPIKVGSLYAATLDGASMAEDSALSSSATVVVQTLVSNPFYVCWTSAGAHLQAGSFALLTLVLFVAGLPVVTLMWIWRDPWLRAALRAGPKSEEILAA
jgi:hypothetical protein